MKREETKDLLILISACVTLASGILLAFLSFFLSVEHAIHNSVLWYFAQCLIYAGSAFGIAAYVKAKIDGIGEINYDDKTKRTLYVRGNDKVGDGSTSKDKEHAK